MKFFDFPQIAIRSQLFHVPGSFEVGALTSGGVRMLSPEPGGKAILELTPALRVNEQATPFASWIMSKVNGEVFKIPLVATPQLIKTPIDNVIFDQPWENNQPWENDGVHFSFVGSFLEGQTQIKVDVEDFGNLIKLGNVFGIGLSSYIVDEVEYEENIATISVKPPLRQNVGEFDLLLLKPFFLGFIANGNEIKQGYEAINNGSVQLGNIKFHEALI